MSRQEQVITITTAEDGKAKLRIIDRINVDDILLHLIRRETYRLTTGQDKGSDVNSQFKNFLLTDRFSRG